MTFIQRTQIINDARYDVAVGTSAGKIETFREAFEVLEKQYPKGYRGRPTGTLDPPYGQILKQCGRFVEHTGIRYYFFHRGAFSDSWRKRKNSKSASKNVDYISQSNNKPQEKSTKQIIPFAGQNYDIIKTINKKKTRERK